MSTTTDQGARGWIIAPVVALAAFMEIMDICTTAGFKNVGFAPPPDVGVGR